MKILIAISFSILTIGLNAQTKIIALKSHSGSAAEFAAQFRGHFELLVGNLGLGPQQITPNANLPEVQFASSKNKRLDSVKYVNEALTICYISQYDKTTKKWNYGVDSVKQDEHFQKSNTLAGVKSYVRSNYYFKNSLQTVKFVGFDAHSTKNNNTYFTPNPGSAPGGNKPFVLFVVGTVLAFAGLFSWRTYKTFQPG
ncbi:MAG TPA: hypothetical protein VK177_14110 [Flavobacteriales bacterium]|nr:hypothetical protein [Flavobacteriales bacterium]